MNWNSWGYLMSRASSRIRRNIARKKALFRLAVTGVVELTPAQKRRIANGLAKRAKRILREELQS